MSNVIISSGFGSFERAVNALQNSTDSDERETAASVLGKSCAAEAIPPLIKALETETIDYIRAIVAGFIGSLRGQNCKEAIVTALSDRSDRVRMYAIMP
jgi:HEAT repeat protein